MLNYFEKAQQELVDTFKLKLKKAAEEVLSDLYTDVSSYASSDAHMNFYNYLKDELRESFIKEVSEKYGHYSWAHSIRMELMKIYPEILSNKIIEDLQEQIKSLKDTIQQLHERRY